MTEFRTEVALLWQTILRDKHSEAFAGAAASSIDRAHGYDRLPQPGYIGQNYRLGRILVLGQNPGNDSIGKGVSTEDLRQYKLLQRLRDAGDAENSVAAFNELMSVLGASVMPAWKIVRKVVQPLVSALDLTLDDIAYTNMVKFRTFNSSFKQSIYDWSWQKTSDQIDLLGPSAIIVLGKGAYKEFLKRYRGSIKHYRVERAIGDTRLPAKGKRDIDLIARQLSKSLGV